MFLPLSKNLRQFIFETVKKQIKLLESVQTLKLSSTMEGQSYLLGDVVSKLNSFADPKLAEGWDNVGLLIEPTQPHHISKILLTNDLTINVMKEALNYKTDLIISYHPPIFAPLKRITQSTWKEQIIASCLENRIALYSPHTAWDAVNGGVGDSLASPFFDYSESVGPINATSDNEQLYEVITSPVNMNNLSNQFSTKIICNIKCNTQEDREIYRIITTQKIAAQITSLPDTIVTKLDLLTQKSNSKEGMGRIVNLKDPGCSLQHCVDLMKTYTGLNHLRLATAINHTQESLIKRIGLVPGSGGSILKSLSADLFITGEMFHHDILDANHRGISVILTNHSDSERPFLLKFKQHLDQVFPNIKTMISSSDRDPIQTV